MMTTEDDDLTAERKTEIADAAGIPQVHEILDMKLDLTRDEKLRATALMMAVSYHKETIVKDGQMYQAMSSQGKNLRATAPQQVVDAACVFEGYLRGQYNEFVTQMVLGVQHAIDDFTNMPEKEFNDLTAPDSDAAP